MYMYTCTIVHVIPEGREGGRGRGREGGREGGGGRGRELNNITPFIRHSTDSMHSKKNKA